MRRIAEPTGTNDDALLRLVRDHAAELLRLARRFSLCADDAHDAYQRALEILVRRMRTAPPDEPLKWLRSVVRNEALTVRAERQRHSRHDELDPERHADDHLGDPAERAAGHERLGHVAEALRRLKPQEVTALVLRAEGLSYKEICARTGWTYTKTNRAVTEGRRALLVRLGAIESGAECARWLPHLSVLADGEAGACEMADLRPHLRACPACRATLRDLCEAPRQVAALVPVALVPLAGDPGGLALRHVETLAHAVLERATLAATRLQGAFEAAPATKLAAVAASTVAIAGGGAAFERTAHHAPTPRNAVEAAAVSPVGAAPRLVLAAPALPRAGAGGTGASRPASQPSADGGGGREFTFESATSPPTRDATPTSAQHALTARAAATAPPPPAPHSSPPASSSGEFVRF